MHREFSINAAVSDTPRGEGPVTLYPPDDTPDAQRGFLFCWLAFARKYLYVASMKPECLVGGKVTAYLMASKYGAARVETRPVLSHLLQGVISPLPSFPLVAPMYPAQ